MAKQKRNSICKARKSCGERRTYKVRRNDEGESQRCKDFLGNHQILVSAKIRKGTGCFYFVLDNLFLFPHPKLPRRPTILGDYPFIIAHSPPLFG